MINILETDSFSGSMQEFLYADNIVITGSWLPYDKVGIYYIKIDSADELYLKLCNVISEDCKLFKKYNNRNIISDLSLWNNSIKSWLNVFSK